MFQFKFKGKGLRPMNLKWWPPTQKEWAPILTAEHKVDWRKQSDPTTGRPWASLTPQYAIEKAKTWPGQLILRASGAMQDGAKIVPFDDGFNAVIRPYGIYHQFGTRKMVARPWLGLPDTALKKLPPIAWKHILSFNK